MPPLPLPSPGAHPAAAAPCNGCGAPLAEDQLFCLSCGARRREARIAFRDVLATEASPVISSGGPGGGGVPPTWGVPAQHGGVPGGPGSPMGGSTPLLGMALCLLLALGLGVWIGRGQDAPPAAAAAPIYAAPTQAVAATTPADQAAAADDAAEEDDAADEEAPKDEDAAADTEAASAPAPDASKELEKLEKLAPSDYQKQAQKLPSELGTGGEAPPKDDKPAGGGSEFEDFQ